MSRISVIVLIFCCILSATYAQDSTKKAAPVTVAPAKTTLQPKTYKSRYPYRSKADSIARAQGRQGYAKTDSTGAPILTDKSLNGQYQFLLGRLYHFQGPFVAELWKSVQDTLKSDHGKMKAAQAGIAGQKKTIDSLNSVVAAKTDAIANSNDSMDVLGMSITKPVYNTVVWGLIAALVIAVAVIVARSGGYRREASYRIKLYGELEEEFKTYKSKANEKEKKLARELQTERNKLDELLGRG